MIFADARALLNDVEACFAENNVATSPEDIALLSEWSNSQDAFGERAREVCQKLFDVYGTRLSVMNRGVFPGDVYFCGDYNNALFLRAKGMDVTFVPLHVAAFDYDGALIPDEDEMASIYTDPTYNILNARPGQYVIMPGAKNGDLFRWNGQSYVRCKYITFQSDELGTTAPLDLWQRAAMDSLANDNFTILYGAPGSGKTLLPMAWMLSALNTGRISRCHFIFHYEKLKHARELGYVKGTLNDKLLQTGSLGNILASKLGDIQSVQRMIQDGQINIIPTSSIRGFEAGSDEMIFCTEAQDLDAYAARTIIQRAKQGCKIVFEGDLDEQVDISRGSGLGKTINAFKGFPGFGCAKLVNDYRSPMGIIANAIK